MKGKSGDIGSTDLTRVSTDALAPEDQRERINRAHAQVVGLYGGQFKDNNSGEAFPVQISLASREIRQDEYLTCPALRGSYSRPDITAGVGVIEILGSWLPAENRLVIRNLDTQGSGTGVPGNKNLNIESTPVRGRSTTTFSGEMEWFRGSGPVTFTKCAQGNRVDMRGNCVRRSRTSALAGD